MGHCYQHLTDDAVQMFWLYPGHKSPSNACRQLCSAGQNQPALPELVSAVLACAQSCQCESVPALASEK